ncbi:hypothetical protein BDQ94DRAFT_143510 [Aspergillus welwitschiae]|uniref:Uncharacterized protein n=1 Tax=Aspergillus welwitschiae TaxID=1341132 RepID=A0A3F3Q3J1_9EURO|nr:hypothetical protein BDQ94DRAFT_143510 [Aspergillus welwitschiae]RDH33655.1 hypothetical protein BDQ94DRAFT_143510 [Aspergillus welwitschiae]
MIVPIIPMLSREGVQYYLRLQAFLFSPLEFHVAYSLESIFITPMKKYHSGDTDQTSHL